MEYLTIYAVLMLETLLEIADLLLTFKIPLDAPKAEFRPWQGATKLLILISALSFGLRKIPQFKAFYTQSKVFFKLCIHN